MGDLSQGIEGGDGMPILDPGKIAPQQPSALFDVTLGHAFLQPVGPDCGANVHAGKSSETFFFLKGVLKKKQDWNFWKTTFFPPRPPTAPFHLQIFEKKLNRFRA